MCTIDFDAGRIEKQDSVLEFEYWDLENKWKELPDLGSGD